MKVCALTRCLDSRNAGLGRVSREIVNILKVRGYEVDVIQTYGNSLYSYFFYTLLSTKPKGQYDVLHALTPMEANHICKESNSIVTFHDLFQFEHPDKLGSGIGIGWKNKVGIEYFKVVARRAAKCSAIVAVSQDTKDALVRYLNIPEEKISVITSGIPESLRKPYSAVRIKTEFPRIGYLGQLDRRKRVVDLIRGFMQGSQPSLVIGGVGVDGVDLMALGRRDPRIHFTGLVPEDSLADFYHSLDVFVFPTMVEGYGLPIVEAMACRKPVVVLEDSVIPYEVKSRCIVVPHLNIFDDKTFYKYVLDKTTPDLLQNNYEWAQRHSWSDCADKYIKIYERIRK